MQNPLALLLLAVAGSIARGQATAPEGGAKPDVPRGWVGVAEAEAARAQRSLREKVLGSLRTYLTQRDSAADHGAGQIASIVALGPDAAPILFDTLKAIGKSVDNSMAGPAARALAGLFDRLKEPALLGGLAELSKSENFAVRAGILEGLETLVHPSVVEIVAPLLRESDPGLRAQAVRVLGRQKPSADSVGALLRPLLTQSNAPVAETLRALTDLGDKAAIDPAIGFMSHSDDATVIAAAIRYCAELGGKSAIAPLRNLLLKPQVTLPDAVSKLAVDATQKIGLREIDAKGPAQDALVEVFRKHPVASLRTTARWALGAYENEDALKSLEEPLLDEIKSNAKAGRGNTARYIELAQNRLHFGQWGRAQDALGKAKEDDDRGLRGDEIERLLAVSLCGLGKFQSAEKKLQQVAPELRLELLKDYPILEKMAKDSRYERLFANR